MVWANGKQNLGLVNSARESRLPMHNSVPFAVKQLRKPETGIKDRFEGMERKVQFGIFPPGKQGCLPFIRGNRLVHGLCK